MWIVEIIILLVGLIGALWFGLKVKPEPFSVYGDTAAPPEAVSLPDNLPAPVARYAHTAIGEQIPVIYSAVITGTGKLTFKGITFHARWRFIHDVGQGYRHYIETTIFGRPLLVVNEWFLDGKSRLELPFGIVGAGPKTDSAAALGLWSEAVWTPSVYFTDPRVRWEAVDDRHARLIVPSGTGEDSYTVTFDAQTGLIARLESMRFQDEKSAEKILWTNKIRGWKTLNGIQVQTPTDILWGNQSRPWFTPEVATIVYNVDVSAYIRARGL